MKQQPGRSDAVVTVTHGEGLVVVRRGPLIGLAAGLAVLLGAVVLLVFQVSGASSTASAASQRASTASAKASAAVAKIAAQQTEIAHLQGVLLASQKASTETRVTTVSSRCHLTMLLYHSVLRVDRPDAAAYKASLDGCLSQLAKVKRIDAQTPRPPSSKAKHGR